MGQQIKETGFAKPPCRAASVVISKSTQVPLLWGASVTILSSFQKSGNEREKSVCDDIGDALLLQDNLNTQKYRTNVY